MSEADLVASSSKNKHGKVPRNFRVISKGKADPQKNLVGVKECQPAW